MESTRVSARLAGYVEAIGEARAAGVTWRQIGELFGVRDKTAAAAFKIARGGKYKVQEQKPLPEPIVKKPREESQAPAQSAKPVQTLEIPKKQDYRTGSEIISQASNFETIG